MERVRLRYAKRGRARFASHRDFARAFERALRRAHVPMAYSAGFTPRPRVSYVGAAPTGAASEAEYLEIGLTQRVDLEATKAELNAALPPGLEVLDAVEAAGGRLAERIEASLWRIAVDVDAGLLADAVAAFMAAAEARVERVTRDGARVVDARGPVLCLDVSEPPIDASCAIMQLVVRQATPAVRPDDVVDALRAVAGLAPDVPKWNVRAARLAQGPLDGTGTVGDPLAADRSALSAPSSEQP